MKLLTKNTDYAVRALVKIAQRAGEPVPASLIAKEERIPYAYLRRLLNDLRDRKVLRSTEGKGGGFVLGRKPEEIFLTDVMEVFQGEVNLTECMFRQKICHNRSTCVLRHKIREIEKKVLGDLEGISIGTLLNETKGQKND
ncbi:MAG TPA: Rrf2 family transcriptional regulator [bacterium]|nr:Rrf2 family transcriptional regulator [bacterium]